MSATARSARPISRWISTVRPFWRPVLASRCVRCPVEAGSIEYSAVSQPRPVPYSQRGTPSSSDAVQSTRVLPNEISAEPCACSRKSGSIVSGRSSSGRRPSDGSCRGRLQLGDRDLLDLAERELQEALAERAEALRVAGRQEPVARPRGPGRSRSPCARASRPPRARSPRPRRRASRRGRRPAGRSAGSAGSACSRG